MLQNSTNPPITQILKQATRTAHDAIEQNTAMHQLMQADLSTAHYEYVLQKKYGYYKAIEQLIMPYLEAAGFPYDERKKAHLAYQDLNGLGRQGADIDALPACTALPTCTNSAEALGILYVLEGSTLGGQMIAKHLLNVLPTHLNTHIRFFSGYDKEKIGIMWQTFQQFLINYSQENPNTQEAILKGANQTFQTLNQWLAKDI